MKSPALGIAIVILLLVIVGGLYWMYTSQLSTSAPTSPSATTITPTTPQKEVTYSCQKGSMVAGYSASSVHLVLSDGRIFNLPQVTSGSGIRYELNAGTPQDMVFTSEGSNAFFTEDGKSTYTDCVAGTDTSTAASGNVMMRSFTDEGKTFTFTYPNAFTVSGGGTGYTQDWMLNATTEGLLLAKVTVPQSYLPKTNFVGATLTVGTSSDTSAVAQCLAAPQNGGPTAAAKTVVTVHGVQYTQYVTTDAGAGQMYYTTSYRTVRHDQCYAIEYTIHSSNIDNYPSTSGITVFDQATIQNALQNIIQSFTFLS
jgi:membrane-bound inhibitor of C-type lysozyme